jgi:hypothetical protein
MKDDYGMSEEQGLLKRRLKPTSHRQGVMQKFLDAVQELTMLQYDKKLFLDPPDGDDYDYLEPKYNPEVIDKMMETLKELRRFDVTEIGPLYLTSGGRIVLDRGYGEYFMDGDTLLYSREALCNGVNPEELINKIRDELNRRKVDELVIKNESH